jgi:hypothetical protein
MTVTINHFGLKDAERYVEPRVVVSLIGPAGNKLESSQETPPSTRADAQHVYFGNRVHLQTPVNHLEEGSCVFFEFGHFKSAKDMISTRCFSFLELREISEGTVDLEIFKKPTDFTRSKLKRLSVKPLYCSIKVSLSVE